MKTLINKVLDEIDVLLLPKGPTPDRTALAPIIDDLQMIQFAYEELIHHDR